MPVLLMLDVVLDFMLDRVHAMTHVALRAWSDDDVSNRFASASGRQGDAARVMSLSRRRSFGMVVSAVS
jgi:hypothetical protein